MLPSKRMFGRCSGKRLKRVLESILPLVQYSLIMIIKCFTQVVGTDYTIFQWSSITLSYCVTMTVVPADYTIFVRSAGTTSTYTVHTMKVVSAEHSIFVRSAGTSFHVH